MRPSDAAYEERRRVHNGAIDRRPAMIARRRGVADVVDAIRLARATGLEVSVRGGGHNVAVLLDQPTDGDGAACLIRAGPARRAEPGAGTSFCLLAKVGDGRIYTAQHSYAVLSGGMLKAVDLRPPGQDLGVFRQTVSL